MERDMDLIFKVLERLEAAPEGSMERRGFALDGYDDNVVWHHVILCEDAGFVRIARSAPPIPLVDVRITWDGYNALDQFRG